MVCVICRSCFPCCSVAAACRRCLSPLTKIRVWPPHPHRHRYRHRHHYRHRHRHRHRTLGITFEITPLGGRGAAGGRGASLTPTAAAAALTPGKAILAKGETAMHMLSPNDRQRLYHVNVERQKVVSEWAFAKDGVEVPQVSE